MFHTLGLHATELQTSSTACVATERASVSWLLDKHPDEYVVNPYWVHESPINTFATEI